MPPGLEGRSLVPLLDQPTAPWQHPAFTLVAREEWLGRSVRTERWCYYGVGLRPPRPGALRPAGRPGRNAQLDAGQKGTCRGDCRVAQAVAREPREQVGQARPAGPQRRAGRVTIEFSDASCLGILSGSVAAEPVGWDERAGSMKGYCALFRAHKGRAFTPVGRRRRYWARALARVSLPGLLLLGHRSVSIRSNRE